MTAEEIQNKIEEAIKPVTEANVSLKKDNDDLKKSNEELSKKVGELEKTSKGSTQGIPPGTQDEQVSKRFPWMQNIKP